MNIMQVFKEPTGFWDNHLKNGSCWEWQGAYRYPNRSPMGYGVVYSPQLKKQLGTHRLAWMLHNQQLIPSGMVIMHRCDNTRCYNPEHLVIGTPKDNVDDMLNKKREGIRMRVTHCVHGHEYTKQNTYVIYYKNGTMQRKCRQCKKEESRRYRLKHKSHVV